MLNKCLSLYLSGFFVGVFIIICVCLTDYVISYALSLCAYQTTKPVKNNLNDFIARALLFGVSNTLSFNDHEYSKVIIETSGNKIM